MTRLLVAGPPCGGKTTYARAHLRPGEQLLDYDDLSAVRYAPDPNAYREWLARLPGADVIVWTAPRRWQRALIRDRYGADVVVVKPPMGVCLDRAAAERPESWSDGVRKWFLAWEPSRSGRETVISP